MEVFYISEKTFHDKDFMVKMSEFTLLEAKVSVQLISLKNKTDKQTGNCTLNIILNLVCQVTRVKAKT